MKIDEDSIILLIKLKYETKPGEEIYIYGDNSDFGNWSSPKFKLSWSKGHIWQADYKLSKSINLIKYKFVCHSRHYNIWEEGENRLLSPNNIDYLPKTEDGKYILNCIWGYFQINFNIHYLLNNSSSNMRIVGSIDALSNWNNPIKLEYDEKKIIKAKDGNEIESFWNITFLLNSKNKKNFDFQYRYSIFDEKTKTAIWEREPNRHIHIFTDINSDNSVKIKDNPDEYKLLTNSYLQILDVNFVADFIFNKMGDKNIYIGPYPQNINDIITLSKSKINAILNVQSEDDLKYRQINLETLKSKSKELNIEYIHYPIKDFDSNDLLDKLKGAGDILNTLLKKDKIVYVHCTAGMSRAAATVIIYLVLYEDFSVESAKIYCKKYRPVICPNYDVINKIAIKYKPGSEMLEKANSNININDEWKKLRAINNIENNNKNEAKIKKVKSKKKIKRLKSILKHSYSFRKQSSDELGVKSGLTRSITFILDNEWEERNLKRKKSENIINRRKFNLDKKEVDGIKKNLFPAKNNEKKFIKTKIKKFGNKPKENGNKKSASVTVKLRDNQNNNTNRNNNKKKIKRILKNKKESQSNNNVINLKTLDKINNNILKTDISTKTQDNSLNSMKNIKKLEINNKNNENENNNIKIKDNKYINIEKEKKNENKTQNNFKEKQGFEWKNYKNIIMSSGNESESRSEILSISLSESEEEEEEEEEEEKEKDVPIKNDNKKKIYTTILNNKNSDKKFIVKKNVTNSKNYNNKEDFNKRSNSITNNIKINFKNRYLKDNKINDEKIKSNNMGNYQFKKNGSINTRIIRAYDEYNSDNRIIKIYNKDNNKDIEKNKQKIDKDNKNAKDKKFNYKYINYLSDNSSSYQENKINSKRNINYIKNDKMNNNLSTNLFYNNNSKFSNANNYINKIQNKNNYNIPHYKITKINNNSNAQNSNNNKNNLKKVQNNCKEENKYINYMNDIDSSSNNFEINSNYNNYNNDTDKNNTNYNSDEDSNTNTNDNNYKNIINKIENSYDSNEGKLFKYNSINNIFNSGNYQGNNSKNNINKNLKFFKPEKKNQYQNKFKYNTNINKKYEPKRITNYHSSYRNIHNENMNTDNDNESNSERSISESISESISQSLSDSESKNKK